MESQHTTRDNQGPFVVRLPFCADTFFSGSHILSHPIVSSKDAPLKEKYALFMKDYETMEHMAKIYTDQTTAFCDLKSVLVNLE